MLVTINAIDLIMILVGIFILIASSYAQVTTDGECPAVSGQKDFDNTKFLGDWYEYGAYNNQFTNGYCTHIRNDDAGNGITKVTIIRKVDGVEKVTSGQYVNDKDDPGKISSVLDGVSFTSYITSTDYDNYATYYSCKNVGGKKQESAWIVMRQKSIDSLPEPARSTLKNYVDTSIYVQKSHLEMEDYTNC